MYRILSFLIVLLIIFTADAQVINLHGIVSNKAGKPVDKAVVTLVGQGLKDTTDAAGSYKITNGTPVLMPLLIPQNELLILDRGFLEFSLPEPSKVSVEVFDIKGKLLKRELQPNASRGFYRFNIKEIAPASKVLIVKASIGHHEVSFRYLPFNKNRNVITENAISNNGRLAKIAVIGDTIKASASGYLTSSIPITSYDQQLNITLDSIGGKAAKPSSGCGKPKTMADSVSASIDVPVGNGTVKRSYILNIPKDYDPNHPYALWFAIHGRGGNALGVARGSAGTNYGYFGMRKLANKDKGTTIFCAPDGSNGLWGSGATDIQFFRMMIKKFEDELCIDQNRIFAAGFSMGGSMSYALACAFPDTFRAIAMHSGGSMSGCSRPANNPGRVPIFMTHGIKDGTNRYPDFGIPQLYDLAQRDGCQTEDVVAKCKPTDPTGLNPVCINFKNCLADYPCRACIFYDAVQNPTGAHTPSPGPVKGNDWGEASTWVPDSTWSFFKQFY